MSRTTSYGTCALCGNHTSKAGMTRHLASCPARHEPSSKGRPAHLLRLRIEGAWAPMYWMDVEIKANAELADLDYFLRQQWLECCGHLSSFYVGNREYTVPVDMMDIFGDKPETMDVKVNNVLRKGTTFRHIYDFGTSTELKLKVSGEREGHIGSDPIRILSRNDAPEYTCMVCGQPATQICTNCMYDNENPFFCENHASAHECAGMDMMLPVVNSPRMGQCGYTGPM